jgi:putative inorganic carbon (HCO3(-)) transporter
MDLSILKKKSTLLTLTVTMGFIALNALFIHIEFFYFSVLPIVLGIVLLAFLSLDKLIMLIVFLTPLSVSLSDLVDGLNFDLALPTEPLLIGVLLVFIMKVLYEGKFDRKVFTHPVSFAIYLNLAWIFITCITSTMPLVSFKFMFARIWFLVSFYFVASQMFKDMKNMTTYIWLYVISFSIVIIYSLVRHVGFGLTQQTAHHVVQPFYNDHTSYGAMLAFFLPVLVGLKFTERDFSLVKQILHWISLVLFSVAIIFSYTRAAWVSLAGAAVIFIVIRLKIKFAYLFLLGILFLGFLYSQRTEILIHLEQNEQVSSDELTEHIKSISNVANDDSNRERLNRWSCAWRMFKEKPVFGWGPGTYMFNYAPFQLEKEKTRISTNAADLGNAHSEYIGPLSESGLLGALTFILIVILTIFTGLRIYARSHDKRTRFYALILLLGLITYYIHGILNNFLDTDKASVVFWGFTAMLVAMDLRTREEVKSEE